MRSAPMVHILSVDQFFDSSITKALFARATELKLMARWQYPKPLAGKIIATLFYEPSTRTRLSFEAAVTLLGGQVITTESAGHFSSASKGETLEDTIRVVSGYADAIVLRHNEVGAAQRAAAVSSTPIINAGDGAGEHPTQALLDLFTIQESKGSVDGLNIGLVGDLKYGRTVHSLTRLLTLYECNIVGIAPEPLGLPAEYVSGKVRHVTAWDDVINQLDVIYMTRIQKERFASESDYEQHKDGFLLDAAVMRRAKHDAIIMHPLPRVGEIAPEVDSDPRALYFTQAKNGLFVRMALLELLLGGMQLC